MKLLTDSYFNTDTMCKVEWDERKEREKTCRELREPIRKSYFVYNLTNDRVLGLRQSTLSWVPVTFLDPESNYPVFTSPLIFSSITVAEVEDLLVHSFVDSGAIENAKSKVNNVRYLLRYGYIRILRGDELDKFKYFYMCKINMKNIKSDDLSTTYQLPMHITETYMPSRYQFLPRKWEVILSLFESLEFLVMDVPPFIRHIDMRWVNFLDTKALTETLSGIELGNLCIQKFKHVIDSDEKLFDPKYWTIYNQNFYSPNEISVSGKIKNKKHLSKGFLKDDKFKDLFITKTLCRKYIDMYNKNFALNISFIKDKILPVSGYFYETIRKYAYKNTQYENLREKESRDHNDINPEVEVLKKIATSDPVLESFIENKKDEPLEEEKEKSTEELKNLDDLV